MAGKMSVPEITNDDLTESKLPSAKCTCEQAPWKSFFEQSAKASWPVLRTIFETLVEEAKAKWR